MATSVIPMCSIGSFDTRSLGEMCLNKEHCDGSGLKTLKSPGSDPQSPSCLSEV